MHFIHNPYSHRERLNPAHRDNIITFFNKIFTSGSSGHMHGNGGCMSGGGGCKFGLADARTALADVHPVVADACPPAADAYSGSKTHIRYQRTYVRRQRGSIFHHLTQIPYYCISTHYINFLNLFTLKTIYYGKKRFYSTPGSYS